MWYSLLSSAAKQKKKKKKKKPKENPFITTPFCNQSLRPYSVAKRLRKVTVFWTARRKIVLKCTTKNGLCKRTFSKIALHKAQPKIILLAESAMLLDFYAYVPVKPDFIRQENSSQTIMPIVCNISGIQRYLFHHSHSWL